MTQYIFKLFAIAQGSAVLGLSIFIFMYYAPKNKNHLRDDLRKHVMFVSLSYICLTIATIQTALFDFYIWGQLWYWIVTIAYIVGDISLIYIFRYAAKRDAINKLKNKK